MSFRRGFETVFLRAEKKAIAKKKVDAIMLLMKCLWQIKQGGFIMKRKMLISIALVLIMLLNCIMPLIPVHADVSDDTAIVFNTKLYKALKNELMANNIPFTYSDTKKSIKVESEVIAQITKLNLNNKGLYDISGLENFTGLKHLELSGNNLSENSNLACISGLPLEYLDLSTNKIGDVSEIDELISTIQSNNGKVVLSNQTVTIMSMNQVAKNGKVQIELPKILSKAGFIKSAWKTVTTDGPSIDTWSDRVSAEGTPLEVNIDKTGLLKLEIYIYDNPTEAASAANLNKAAENMLYQSKFFIYVVVHNAEETPIHIPDINMYKEIKKQLTQGTNGIYPNPNGNIEYGNSEPNKDLSSYPYSVDENGEVIFDECTIEIYGEYTYLTPKGETESKYVIIGNVVYLLETGEPYTLNYEETTIKYVDSEGNITQKFGYKIPLKGENETLYEKAYDEPQVFVINDYTLMNKITSLVLNNKQIRDISGIEYFVGLKTELNLSQNYLTDIDPLYNLQANKEIYEDKLQAKYNEYLLNKKEYNLNYFLNEAITAKKEAESAVEEIKNIVESIIQKFDEAAEISKIDSEGKEDPEYASKLKKKADEINALVKQIYGSPAEEIEGLLPKFKEKLNDTENSLYGIYNLSSILYDIYYNEYKLLTMLSDELNYLDIVEYEDLQEKLENTEEAKKLVADQVSILKDLETKDAFTHFEEDMLYNIFGIIVGDEDRSVAQVFKDELEVEYIDIFTEMALYSEMVNYCTIKRMEKDSVGADQCFCQEYLKNRIKEFEYEGILPEEQALEYKILAYLERFEQYVLEYKNNSFFGTGDVVFDSYLKYYCENILYSNERETIGVETCLGRYERVTNLGYDYSDILTYKEIYEKLKNKTTTDLNGATAFPNARENTEYIYNQLNRDLPENINIYEFIKDAYRGEENKLYLYEEAVKLATRFVNSNVERYVTLPDLKKLDISNNADLEGIERISELTTLREFYANADYLGNIQDVNWEDLRYVKRLGLAYNYITDISCLNVLDHLVDLDVSHNLIAGKLNFNLTKSQDTLRNLDLSYNQIDDITVIQEFLDIITFGKYANFLAKEDTININLNNQNLNIEVKEPISLKEFPLTVNIEMPKIFTQLLSIDTERTSFGITSEDGRIESEGTYVTLNTVTEGKKTAKVSVIAQSGSGKPVETCVGEGTTATIIYTVVESENPGTNPENPGTTPENPGTTPENPGTNPENPGTTPENPGTTPENPGTTPENPGTTPENPGTKPVVDEIDVNTLGYETEEEYIKGIKAKTSIEDFARILLNGKEYNVVVKKEDKDGNKTIVTEGNIGTGMYVQVQDEDGNVIKDKKGDLVVYEIIVKGDINGDGLANSLDSILIKAYRNEVTNLSGSAKVAADINEDGKVNVSDSKLLLYHRAEVTGYNLNYQK